MQQYHKKKTATENYMKEKDDGHIQKHFMIHKLTKNNSETTRLFFFPLSVP